MKPGSGMQALTSDGKFRGQPVGNGSVVFRGIVYARYTRFGLPEIVDYGLPGADVGVSEGGGAAVRGSGCETAPCVTVHCNVSAVCDAVRYGCVCPQDLSHLNGQLGPDSGLEMREGELCLSVTVPPGDRTGLPVMVWIHGGSYLTGGSEDHRYDVSSLAETGNVIVVKISYRLGAEGYLWMPERGAANLGLEDQKTALRWIRRHISSFGGDPDNVTIWGQSAGAHSVASLIASADDAEPLTNVPRIGGEILFRRAILQSPPLGIGMSVRDAEKLRSVFLCRLSGRSGEVAVEEMGRKAGADDAEGLWKNAETAPVEELIAVQTSMKRMHLALPFMPVLPDCTSFPRRSAVEKPVGSASAPAVPESSGNGVSVPSSSVAESPRCRPAAAGTPFRVLLCYNKDDASVYARKILGRTLYRTPLGAVLTKILTSRIFASPAEKYLKKLRQNGVGAALYRFSWHPEGSPLGCCHSIELPFLLGRPEDWTSAEMLRGMTEEEYRCHSTAFKTLWTEFARSGSFPSAGSLA